MNHSIEDVEKDVKHILGLSRDTFESTDQWLRKLLHTNPPKLKGVSSLVLYSIDRLRTVMLLTEQGNLWDAEIIFRSALESFSKFLYIISSSDSSEVERKLREFWEDTAEIGLVEQDKKARHVLAKEGEAGMDVFKAMLLSEEKLLELKAKPSWSNRNKLGQEWSFSGILVHFIKNPLDGAIYSMEILSHYYKMASHIAHGDSNGISIIEERNEREEYHKAVSKSSGAIKLCGVVVNLTFWMTLEICSYLERRYEMGMMYNKYLKFENERNGLLKKYGDILDILGGYAQ